MSEEITVYNELEAGIASLKGKYKDLPDVKTKVGYNVVKINLKDCRDIVGQIEEVRLSEGRKHRAHVAGVKAARIIEDDKLKEYITNVNNKAAEILKIVDDVFKPHKEAKDEEDHRAAEKKRLAEEAEAKRLETHKASIDEIRNRYINAIEMTAGEVVEVIASTESMVITEETFEEFEVEANALRSAIVGKLEALLESKKSQEETKARLAAVDAEREANKEAQDKADAERKVKQDAEDKARQAAVEKDNAAMKVKLAEMEKKQKETDEAAAKVKADADKLVAEAKRLKEEAEKIERETKEASDLKVKEKEDRLAKESVDAAAAELKVKEEAEDKKVKEAAKMLAEKEASQRRDQLINSLMDHFDGATYAETFIKAIENNEIPYLRINWLEK